MKMVTIIATHHDIGDCLSTARAVKEKVMVLYFFSIIH